MDDKFTFAEINSSNSYSVGNFYEDFVFPAEKKGVDLFNPDAYELLFSSGDIQAKSFFHAFDLPVFAQLEFVDTECMLKKLDNWESENQRLNKREPEKWEAVSCVVNILKSIVHYKERLSRIYLYMEDFLWKSMDSLILDKCRNGKMEISAFKDLNNIAENTGLVSVVGFQDKLRLRIDDVFSRLRAVNANLPSKLEIVDSTQAVGRKSRIPKKILLLVAGLISLLAVSPFLFMGIAHLKGVVNEKLHEKKVRTMLKENHEESFYFLVSQLKLTLEDNNNLLLEIDEETETICFSAVYYQKIQPFLALLSNYHAKYHSKDRIPRGSDAWKQWMWFNSGNNFPDQYDHSAKSLTVCPYCIAIDYKVRKGDDKLKTNVAETYLYKDYVAPVLKNDLRVLLEQTDEKLLRNVLAVGEGAYDEDDFLSRFVYREHLMPVIREYLEKAK